MDGQTILYAIIGNPVEKSLSPKIHNFLFQHWNINACYVPLQIEKQNFKNTIKSLTSLNFQGANITVPYKQLIIKQLDAIDDYAQKIGSVNTIINESGKWKGYSTDGVGFIKGLQDLNVNIEKSKILIVGAGGAARAIAFALAELKPTAIYLKNRSKKNLTSLISDLHKIYPVKEYADDEIDLLINATSIGMDGVSLAVEKNIVVKATFVVDLIYAPAQTQLLKLANKLNKKTQNGLPMLLNQAEAAFKIWTKKSTKIAYLEQALKTSRD